jgi:hypothetical protein
MLASITPLGERGRRSRWWLTVTAFLIGAAAGGAALGALLGAAGAPLPDGDWTLAVALVLAGAGALVDAGVAGLRVPTLHRQVDDGWLDRYRGWVYGVGFGFQLGLGITTVVTTAAVYVTWIVAFLSGSWWSGTLIGLAFGLTRGLAPLSTARIHQPEQLHRRHRRIAELEPASRRLAILGQVAVATVAAVVLLGVLGS